MKKYTAVLILLFSVLSVSSQDKLTTINIELAKLDAPQEDLSEYLIDLNTDLSITSFENSIELLASQQTQLSKRNSSESVDKYRFEQLTEIKGVDVVYISKTMLSMMPKMTMPGVNVSSIASKLESIEILSSESKSTATTLKLEIDKYIKKGNYETLMYMKDDDSKTGFFFKRNPEKNNSEMIMITQDSDDTSVIRFLGNFTIQDIQNIAKKK